MKKKEIRLFFFISGLSLSVTASASSTQRIHETAALYGSGQYFTAARYAFDAIDGKNKARDGVANAWVTLSLVKAGFPNAATYFYLRTLQSKNKNAISQVLNVTPEILNASSLEVIRPWIARFTTLDDYSDDTKNAFLYAIGKTALLTGKLSETTQILESAKATGKDEFWPWILQVKATAQALSGSDSLAIETFSQCRASANEYADFKKSQAKTAGTQSDRIRLLAREGEDLAARCHAGMARTYYQGEQFSDADRTYDGIQKESIVWPDILFEQAWNSYALKEYNRTLGRLVTYRSPVLQFVFNPEVDLLNAQTYLALCLYGDVNQGVKEFQDKYEGIGKRVKSFVEHNSKNLSAFYELGKKVTSESLYSKDYLNQMVNRFARSPYFLLLVDAERQISSERVGIKRFDERFQDKVKKKNGGFPAFLNHILDWRVSTIKKLGGVFIKNHLIDEHAELVSEFEKISYIKLEMLRRAKETLMYGKIPKEARFRGNEEPKRKDSQYYWNFNGEFWTDELGDYVFGLSSQCKKQDE